MSKISDISVLNVGPRATNIEGLHVKDIPLVEVERLQSIEDKTEQLKFLFAKVICDPQGNQFADVKTVKQIKGLGVLKLAAINRAVMEVLNETGKDSDETPTTD